MILIHRYIITVTTCLTSIEQIQAALYVQALSDSFFDSILRHDHFGTHKYSPVEHRKNEKDYLPSTLFLISQPISIPHSPDQPFHATYVSHDQPSSYSSMPSL